jgi:type I restriction enzyme S subunit
VDKGDFVYNRLFGWKGSFAVATAENHGCYVSNEFPCFAVDSNLLEDQYLRWYFTQPSAWQEALGLSAGGTPTSRNRLKEEKLLRMRIPLPPVPEQRRIVARIEELAGKTAEAWALRQHALAEADSVVVATARKLLTAVDARSTELGSWLDPQRDGIQTGPFGAQLGSSDFVPLGIPVLTIGNVQYGGLSLSGLKYVSSEKVEDLARYRIKTGDILFARMGTVGRCCIAPPEAEGWLINYHIIRVALDRARVEPRYIVWSIRASPDVEEYLEDKIRGATREGVNSTIVAGLPVRIPSVAFQRQIVAQLDELELKVGSVRALQAGTAAELEALLPSVLEKAFKGGLV